jgi:predicted nucleic acid-binding protein
VKASGSLVDTSVWVDFFRGISAVKGFLEKLVEKDTVFTAGPILFEILQGIKSSEEKDQVKEALLSMNYLEITPLDWEGAALLSRELRAKGFTIPMTDLLIAQLAKSHNLEVISLDPHFDHIPVLNHRKPSL